MKKTTILIIGILVLVVGCNTEKETEETRTDITGSEGVSISFYGNTPPSKVLEGQNIPLGIRITNNGACDILPERDQTEPGRCQIPGSIILSIAWDERTIKLYWEDNIEDDSSVLTKRSIFTDKTKLTNINKGGRPAYFLSHLYGKRKGAEKGQELVATFTLKSLELTKSIALKESSSNVVIGLCSPYRTIATTEVCIDPDLFGLNTKEKGCTLEGDQKLGTQGAPIAVTDLQIDMLPTTLKQTIPRFVFTIKKLAPGEIIAQDIESLKKACNFEILGKKEKNTIKFKASMVQGDLKCSSSLQSEKKVGEIDVKLDQKTKQAKIVCEADPIDQGTQSFTTPIVVQLDYGYTDKLAKEIKIERILRR